MPPEAPKPKTASGDITIALTVDGVVYHLNPRELDHTTERALFAESGLTLPQLMTAMSGGSGAPFMLAALVFLARRQRGDRVTYDEVASAIGYDTEVDVVLDAGGEGSAPEAPGAD